MQNAMLPIMCFCVLAMGSAVQVGKSPKGSVDVFVWVVRHGEIADESFEVGGKVLVKRTDGSWTSATITAIEGMDYQVKWRIGKKVYHKTVEAADLRDPAVPPLTAGEEQAESAANMLRGLWLRGPNIAFDKVLTSRSRRTRATAERIAKEFDELPLAESPDGLSLKADQPDLSNQEILRRVISLAEQGKGPCRHILMVTDGTINKALTNQLGGFYRKSQEPGPGALTVFNFRWDLGKKNTGKVFADKWYDPIALGPTTELNRESEQELMRRLFAANPHIEKRGRFTLGPTTFKTPVVCTSRTPTTVVSPVQPKASPGANEVTPHNASLSNTKIHAPEPGRGAVDVTPGIGKLISHELPNPQGGSDGNHDMFTLYAPSFSTQADDGRIHDITFGSEGFKKGRV